MNMQPGRLLDADFRLFSPAQLADGAMPHGESVRVRKLGSTGYVAPNALYLVYVKLEANGNLTVRHMSRDTLLNNSVADTENDLFDKAAGGGGPPEQVGGDFDTMVFDGPTYFTIVLDNADWDFYYPRPSVVVPVPNENHDPIVFIKHKVTLVEQAGGQAIRVPKDYEPNTSFFDAQSVTVRGRAAVRCINFFCEADGSPLVRWQDVGFEVLVRVPCSLSATVGRKLILIIDPDGQNQGPST